MVDSQGQGSYRGLKMEEITKETVHKLIDTKKKEKRDNETEIEACNRRISQLNTRNVILSSEIAALEKDVPIPTAKVVEIE